MKFTINLQPTIAIERDPSKSFAAAQITLLAIPLVAFIIIGFFYWHALARQEEIAAKVTSVEAEKTKLNNQRKRGLKAADRKSIEEHRDILRSIFKERTPTTGLLLAKLEETIPNDCYANWMSLERLGEKSTYRLNMRGRAPNPSSIANLAEGLQNLPKASLSVKTLSRKSQHWEFELLAMLVVETPESKESTLVTTSTTGEVSVQATAPTSMTTADGGAQ